MRQNVSDPAGQNHVVDLKLCAVFLEENSLFPWLRLVLRGKKARNMREICMEDRLQLMRETALAEEALNEVFETERIDIAIPGDKDELYVDLISRCQNDAAWPGMAWQHRAKPYDEETRKDISAKIRREIMIKMTDKRFFQN